MKLRRLREMKPAEVAGRSRQAIARWLERSALAGRGRSRPHAVFSALAADPDLRELHARARGGDPEGAARVLRDRFRAAAPARFFPGASGADIASAAAAFPGHREGILAAADAAAGGRFDLLGYTDLSFGTPVDWHLDAVSGRRAPEVHWSRIDFLDVDAVGDHKVTWELSRQQWLVRLAQAYQLTGEERYGEAALAFLEQWLRANPPGRGVNWASSLEAAIRIMSWSWTLVLLREATALSPGRFEAVLQAIWIHASHVERHLSRYFSPNTHLTGEALGLFYAGVLFPELRRAPRWRKTGEEVLRAECRRQVLADGVHFELSTCYQRYMVETFVHFVVLARRNGVPVPEDVEHRLRQMTEFLVALRRPDGTVPSIGDADGGWLMPLAVRDPADMRGVFSLSAALWQRPEHAWAAEGAAPETLWMLGREGVERARAVEASPPPGPASRVYPAGGYVVMRSDWSPEAHQLVFDVGPLGCPVTAGHGHADLLAIQCVAFGETFLVDPGTGSYTDSDGWRSYFRSTAAHSTILVDGRGQASPAGPFVWDHRPGARLLRWRSDGDGEVAEGEHDAYQRLAAPVRHRRRVFFIDRAFWVVVDDLEGLGLHDVTARFQFAPLPVAAEDGEWVRARGRERGLLLRALASVPVSLRISEGRRDPREGWVSAHYGTHEPAPMAVYALSGELPMRIATLILPLPSPDRPRPDVHRLGEGATLGGLGVGARAVRFG